MPETAEIDPRLRWPYQDAAVAELSPGLPYVRACERIATILHALLQAVPREGPISTTELANRVMCSAYRKTHAAEFNRLFRIMKDLARGQMLGCTSPGAAKVYMGKRVNPRVWHTGDLSAYEGPKIKSPLSTAEIFCQHCGGIL